MNFSIWNILKKRDPNDRFHRTEIASPISRLIWKTIHGPTREQ